MTSTTMKKGSRSRGSEDLGSSRREPGLRVRAVADHSADSLESDELSAGNALGAFRGISDKVVFDFAVCVSVITR